MTEQYLILHKVRGEPAFDIAERMPCPHVDVEDHTGCPFECVEGYWWVTSTHGHRAYPWMWWLVSSVIPVDDPIYMPENAREHFEIRAAPPKPKANGGRAIAFLQGLGVLPQETDRRA